MGYVRTLKQIPYGLSSLEAKVSNITHQEPEVGLVAVTDESAWGHVAYVTEVGDNDITVIESNYFRGYITTRLINKDLVLGYM